MKQSRSRKIVVSLILFVGIMAATMLHTTTAKAAGAYYIQVNKTTNVVTVFNNDGTPNRAFACSDGDDTPLGTFYTKAKYTWKLLYFNSYGQYSTRITGSILFHSVPYNAQNKASQSYRAYNKLGETASHGCIRLTTEAAKWIYDNCPVGTQVNIINGTAMNDPLGKPATIRVNAALGMGWDPTDPDPSNPYATATPSISVANVVRNLEYNEVRDLRSGVVAYDSCGNDISGQVTLSGTVDVKRLGSYTVSYYVTDALGRSASTSVTYQVVDTKKATIKGVKSKRTQEYKSSLTLRKGISAKTVDNKKLTSKIKVKIVYPGSKKEKTYTKSKLTFTKVGTYKINYYVKNPNNGKMTKMVCKVTVRDTKAPIVKGVSAKKTAEYNATLNLMSKVSAKKVSGTSLTKKIKVYVKAPKSKKWKLLKIGKQTKYYKLTKLGTYQVKYIATNTTSNKKTTKIMKLTVKDTKAPVVKGVKSSRTADYTSNINFAKGISAKKVSGASLTKNIKIYLQRPDSSKWYLLSGTKRTSYKLSMAGTYRVKYVAVNSTSKKKTEKITKLVVRDMMAPLMGGVIDFKQAEYNSTLDLTQNVTAQLPSKASNVSPISISVLAPGATSWSTELDENQSKAYAFASVGEYQVRYCATNTTSKKTTEKFMKVTVMDTATPTLSLADVFQSLVEDPSTHEYLYGLHIGDSMPLTTAQLQAAIPSGGAVKTSVQITDAEQVTLTTIDEITDTSQYTFEQAGEYTVTITAMNPSKVDAPAKITIRVTVTDAASEEPLGAPVIKMDADSTGESKAETEPETEIESETEAEPETETELELETATESETETESESETESVTERELETETESETVIETESEVE